MSELTTVYVSIGNSDDKLTQARWHEYWVALRNLVVVEYAERVHGEWWSVSVAPYQNGCVCLELNPAAVPSLQGRLRALAAEYGQDSIAWAEARTQFLAPPGNPAGRP